MMTSRGSPANRDRSPPGATSLIRTRSWRWMLARAIVGIVITNLLIFEFKNASPIIEYSPRSTSLGGLGQQGMEGPQGHGSSTQTTAASTTTASNADLKAASTATSVSKMDPTPTRTTIAVSDTDPQAASTTTTASTIDHETASADIAGSRLDPQTASTTTSGTRVPAGNSGGTTIHASGTTDMSSTAGFSDKTGMTHKIQPGPQPLIRNQTNVPIWWWAPIFDKTSFGKEASMLLLGLLRSGAVKEEDVWVHTKTGHCQSGEDKTMPPEDVFELKAAEARANPSQAAIIVCHMLPPFWSRPKNKWKSCAPCPPVGYQPAVAVGRAMAETDLFHPEFSRIARRMDEIWTPSHFSLEVLNKSGIPVDKIRVVPLAVNTTYFDPDRWEAAKLPMGELVFGASKQRHSNRGGVTSLGRRKLHSIRGSSGSSSSSNSVNGDHSISSRAINNNKISGSSSGSGSGSSRSINTNSIRSISSGSGSGSSSSSGSSRVINTNSIGSSSSTVTHSISHAGFGDIGDVRHTRRSLSETATKNTDASVGSHHTDASVESTEVDRPFVFSSCFKWESRKGWDVLLNAYLSEFTSADNVELYILTKPFQGSDYKADMQSWVTKNIGAISNASMPTLYVIPTHVSNSEYVGLLKASDAYVMPTRGEGWGMPISEAMSMALPVIVTNWSGPTAFVDKSIGYPLTKYTLVDVGPEEPWWFRGARWADVDVQHLRQVMRHVFNNRAEARMKGEAGRRKMVEHFSPEAVGSIIAAEMDRLNNMLRSGGPCDRCFNSEWVAPPGDTKPAYYSGKEPFLKKMDTVGGLVASSDKNKRHRTKMDGFQSKSSRNASSRASKSLDRGNRVSASVRGTRS